MSLLHPHYIAQSGHKLQPRKENVFDSASSSATEHNPIMAELAFCKYMYSRQPVVWSIISLETDHLRPVAA